MKNVKMTVGMMEPGHSAPPRRKVRSGCRTCRTRRVKCDEKKPHCQRCLDTGRTCDGYRSPILVAARPRNTPALQQRNTQLPSLVLPQDILEFKRILSTKTMRNIVLDCDDEARSILEAVVSDEPLQHAVSSLKAIRQDLEAFGEDQRTMERSTSAYSYGLQQYCLAMNGLVFRLASPTSENLRSALLCCQMFMSIEQTRGNYIGIVQHFARGHQIMIENHARPYLDTQGILRPADHEKLPLVDLFFIKLFAAPCRLGEKAQASDVVPTTTTTGPVSTTPTMPMLVPNMRGELKKVAFRIRDFLDEISKLDKIDDVLRLRMEKITMLRELESWEQHLDDLQSQGILTETQAVGIAFMRLFKHVLRIILTRTLDHPLELEEALKSEQERLQSAAESVVEKLRLGGAMN